MRSSGRAPRRRWGQGLACSLRTSCGAWLSRVANVVACAATVKQVVGTRPALCSARDSATYRTWLQDSTRNAWRGRPKPSSSQHAIAKLVATRRCMRTHPRVPLLSIRSAPLSRSFQMTPEQRLDLWLAEEREVVELLNSGPGVGVARPAQLVGKSGLEVMHAMMNGQLPYAEFAKHLSFYAIAATPGLGRVPGHAATRIPQSHGHHPWRLDDFDPRFGAGLRGARIAAAGAGLHHRQPRDPLREGPHARRAAACAPRPPSRASKAAWRWPKPAWWGRTVRCMPRPPPSAGCSTCARRRPPPCRGRRHRPRPRSESPFGAIRFWGRPCQASILRSTAESPEPAISAMKKRIQPALRW